MERIYLGVIMFLLLQILWHQITKDPSTGKPTRLVQGVAISLFTFTVITAIGLYCEIVTNRMKLEAQHEIFQLKTKN